MLPITGYANTLSVEPGGCIDFKISSTEASDYQATLVRLFNCDPNPQGPGPKTIELPQHLSRRLPAVHQPVLRGSFARIPGFQLAPGTTAMSCIATIYPTHLADGREQALLSFCNRDAGTGFRLSLRDSRLVAIFTEGAKQVELCSHDSPLALAQWYRVWWTMDTATGVVTLGVATSLPGFKPAQFEEQEEASAIRQFRLALPATWPAASEMCIGAALLSGTGDCFFNGKIEDPAIFSRELSYDAAVDPADYAGREGLVAWWDFSQAISTQQIVDRGPFALHGSLVNLPTRAVTGSRWSGSHMRWSDAPLEYAAIHFHEDDVHDLGWDTSFSWEVPADMPSGSYAMRLDQGGVTEYLPFYVRPKLNLPTARLVFLAPTYTYMAYGNHARGNCDAGLRARLREWSAYGFNTDDHADYGASTYNRHADGSGICFSSRLRPLLTFRPGYLTFLDTQGSGLRHFTADSHLIGWLDHMGIPVDIITDEDLERDGVDLLAPYQAVVTGSHPEYHTQATLDALRDYAHRRGGRLAYLGGNGFYWRIARSDAVPGVIEVRRAEGGIRAWECATGEYYHALDGQYGGLWRRNGRPPQELAGVGFSAQGPFTGTAYRRSPDSYDPSVRWIFDGVESEVFGGFGLSGGGAAGFEVDRADHALGTPAQALILASSQGGHAASYIPVFEELLNSKSTATGAPRDGLARADMVWIPTAKGGAVFAVGSITFCGSLPSNGYRNDISSLLGNVLRHFLQAPASTATVDDEPTETTSA